jgi:hypothetical protein
MEKMFMNRCIGLVASESEWRENFESMDQEAWGHEIFERAGLIEVVPDGEGGWREADS